MAGAVLYQGKSCLDSGRIVCILTGFSGSENRKTGNMVQSWILRSDMSPLEALQTGNDFSVCGNCKHRGMAGKRRSCYVQVHQAPLSVYRAFLQGNYPRIDTVGWDILQGKSLRVGSYGDPAAVPAALWKAAIRESGKHTGYTHQWIDFPEFKGLLMASCDNVIEYQAAVSLEWKTFRILKNPADIGSNEILCRNYDTGISCEKCGICNGRKNNVAVPVHGIGKKYFQG